MFTMSKPKYPQYAVTAKRLESFKNWPSYLGIKAKLLAEAGLVYTDVGDAVRCYHCGGGLRNWDPGDDPWLEHAKWYSECPHILLVKGQSYVDKVLNGERVDEGSDKEEDDVVESTAALSCLQMGYESRLVQKAIRKYVERERNSRFKGADIAELCEELKNCDISDSVQSDSVASGTENENIDDLLEENQKLKDNVACKICLEGKATVIFLPCGHMVSCPQCAQALVKCPMCRCPVTGYVKAMFA